MKTWFDSFGAPVPGERGDGFRQSVAIPKRILESFALNESNELNRFTDVGKTDPFPPLTEGEFTCV
jgi:hypothetical protein